MVEDEPAVAELLRTLLNRVPGWRATAVHHASAAAEVFKHVEVLVLHMNLPGISGPDLLEHLRHVPHSHEPPVILLSANPELPPVADALAEAKQRCEPLVFVAEPFHVDDLVDAVAAAAGALQREGGGPTARDAGPPTPAAS